MAGMRIGQLPAVAVAASAPGPASASGLLCRRLRRPSLAGAFIATQIAAFACFLSALPAGAQWWSGHGPSGTGASTSHYSSTTSTIFSGRPSTSTYDNAFSPGVNSYYNNAGLGYYRANPTATGFPAYVSPVNLGGGYPQLGGPTERTGYWRAASGFYYPWLPPVFMPGVKYGSVGTVYSVKDGVVAPAKPSVGQVLADMRECIEVAKDKKQLDAAAYENLYRRLNELTARATEQTTKDGGTLSAEHDAELRKAIELLGADLSRTMNP